jgi:hypothetical protein
VAIFWLIGRLEVAEIGNSPAVWTLRESSVRMLLSATFVPKGPFFLVGKRDGMVISPTKSTSCRVIYDRST